MRTYQVASLAVVGMALAFAVGIEVGEQRVLSRVMSAQAAEDCCGPLVPEGTELAAAPSIPTGSGLPCLVAFGSGTCSACKKVETAIDELAPRLDGAVDVVHLDPDTYPAAARERGIRTIPTQILVNAAGEEVDRFEGAVTADELRARLEGAGFALN